MLKNGKLFQKKRLQNSPQSIGNRFLLGHAQYYCISWNLHQALILTILTNKLEEEKWIASENLKIYMYISSGI